MEDFPEVLVVWFRMPVGPAAECGGIKGQVMERRRREGIGLEGMMCTFRVQGSSADKVGVIRMPLQEDLDEGAVRDNAPAVLAGVFKGGGGQLAGDTLAAQLRRHNRVVEMVAALPDGVGEEGALRGAETVFTGDMFNRHWSQYIIYGNYPPRRKSGTGHGGP